MRHLLDRMVFTKHTWSCSARALNSNHHRQPRTTRRRGRAFIGVANSGSQSAVESWVAVNAKQFRQDLSLRFSGRNTSKRMRGSSMLTPLSGWASLSVAFTWSASVLHKWLLADMTQEG
jgi:hypothetical protein